MGLDAYLAKKQKEAQAKQVDYEPFVDLLTQSTFRGQAEEAKPKVSWWKKLISVLSTGETGHAAYQALTGKNPLEEYGKDVARSISGQGYERKTYADVLEKIGFSTNKLSDLFPDLYSETGDGWQLKEGGFLDWSANGTVGLALDIALDPKTYMGGLGLFQRMGTKGKGLTKAGKSIQKGTDDRIARIYDEVGKSIDFDQALNQTQEITERMIKKFSSNPDKYYSGITLFGKNFIPRKVALAPGRLFDHTMQHIPVAGKVYTGAKAGVQDMFKYGADVIRQGKSVSEVGEETAEKYIQMQQQMYKRSREISDNLFDDLSKAMKEFRGGIPKDKREATLEFIRNKIETNFSDFKIEGVDKELVDNLTHIFEKNAKQFYRTEAASRAGLARDMYSELSGYLPHLTTEEAQKVLKSKAANKYLAKGYNEFVNQPEKAREWYRFINTKTGKEVFGSKNRLKLQEFRKGTEEAWLTTKAQRLIDRRQLRIKQLMKEMDGLTKKQLQEALREDAPGLANKIAKLKVTPAGRRTLTEVGESPQGLRLLRESFTKTPKYQLQSAALTGNETLQFINDMIKLPKKSVLKFGKKINTRQGWVDGLLKEINSITDDLAKEIDELPNAARWFKNADGEILRATRHASIDEINKILQPMMDEVGVELGIGKGKKFFMTDPFEIIYQRGQKSAKNIAAAEYYQNVLDNFGLKAEPIEVFKRNPKTRKMVKELAYEEFTDPATKIRYVDPKMADLPDGTLLPDFIVRDLKKVKEFVDDEKVGNKLLQWYDKMILEWKGSVYGWYPASHGRNLIGGGFNNWLAGVAPGDKRYRLVKKILNGADGFVTTKNGAKIPYSEIKKQMIKLGVLGQTGYLDVNELRKAFNPSAFKRVKDIPMKAMENVENTLRIPLFIKGLEDTGSFEGAAKLVFKYHFDYAPEALSTFEKTVMKRLIPFYRWTRGNIPLMLEEFIAQPAKMTGLFKALREMQDENGNLVVDLLPSYIEKEFAITKGGDTVTGTGLPPIEMLKMMREPSRSLESGLTPFLKIPLELRTNYSLFKDMSIMEDTSGNFAENYPEPIKKWLQYEEKKVTKKDGTSYTIKRVDPMRKYWLYALPSARISSLATTLLGEREQNKLMNSISGLRTYEFDMQQLRESQQRMYEEKLIEIFTNAGLFGQIQYPFADIKERAGMPGSNTKSKNPLLNR